MDVEYNKYYSKKNYNYDFSLKLNYNRRLTTVPYFKNSFSLLTASVVVKLGAFK